MKIVSLLWPTADPVLVELARAGWLSFAWFQAPGAETIAELARLGAGGEMLLDTDPDSPRPHQHELAQLVTKHLAPLGAASNRTAEVTTAAIRVVGDAVNFSRGMIDALERLYEREGVALLLLNQTETRSGRVCARWARTKNIPVFMLTHGANLNRYYTCTAGLEADRVFVFGERSIDAFLDQGQPHEKFSVTGNPGWDQYAAVRANRAAARRNSIAALGLRPDEPTILFVTTWSAKLSAHAESELFERTLSTFFAACARLRGRGAQFNAVVKGRPMNADAESTIAELAHRAGFTDYIFASGPIAGPLAAADVVVGIDTSVFVEAMLLDIPSVNLWAEPSWILGPPYAGYDAVPLVLVDDPDALARYVGRLLVDPDARNAALGESAERVGSFSPPADGGSAARIAAEIVAALPPAPARWSVIDAAGRDAVAATSEHSPLELVDAIVRPPRIALVCDVGSGTIARALKARFPAARIIGTESNPAAAARANSGVDSLIALAPEALVWPVTSSSGELPDTVILPGTLHRCINPWRFLQRIRAALPPDGQLIAMVWNLRNLWTLVDVAKGTARYGHEGAFALEHLRWFTLSELQVLFRDIGFPSVRIDGHADPRSHTLGTPPEGVQFDLNLPELTLRGLTTEAFAELRTARYVVSASALA